MNAILRKALAVPTFLALTYTASAQPVIYRDCVITDVAAFNAAVTSFYESITGVEKPAAALHRNIFNGELPTTHLLVEEFTDYAAVEAWQNRVQELDGPRLQLFAGMSQVASCETEGFVIPMASWGDPADRGDYHVVFPITTTDAATYAEAMDRLQTSREAMQIAPGPAALYGHRSGVEGPTHYVVQWGDTFAAVNDWMDTYPQMEAFAAFTEQVSSTRTVGLAVQRQTIMSWNQ